MKAIMYHYVREYNPSFPNFRFLDVGNFRRQLDYFAQRYGFVTYDEWCRFIADGRLPSQPEKIVLTFDDAMCCHYDFVYPELRKRGLWGSFYVATSPYLDDRILDVHRIHLLCGAIDGRELLRVAREVVTEDMIPFARREEFCTRTYTQQTNYEGVSEFKRLLNYFLAVEWRTPVIDEISRRLAFEARPAGFYVDVRGLRAMAANGMVIGSHGNTHPVMSTLAREAQEAELEISFGFLDDFSNGTRTYCHPYGGFHSFNDDTVALLNEFDVKYSFNVEPRDIDADDHARSTHHLPRYDCNLFPFGTAS